MPRRTSIRPDVLRAYYDVTYGRGAFAADSNALAFRDATFDEYYALARLKYPDITPRHAATLAHTRPDLQKLAPKLPGDESRPPRDPEPWNGIFIVSRARADLRKAGTLPKGSHALTVNRVKSVVGWEGLRSIRSLRRLSVSWCGVTKVTRSPRAALDEVVVHDVAESVVETVLWSTSAKKLVLHACGTIDLTPLAGHTKLQHLSAGTCRNVAVLAKLPLEHLTLHAELDDDLHAALTARTKTLRSFGLSGSRAVGPDDLPDLSKLDTLRISGHPEHRDAWIEWAVAHPLVRCDFTSPPVRGPREPSISVAAVHRGVDILAIAKGKKIEYEVSGDLADEFGYPDSNGDLEDDIAPLARAAKKKITWSSEAGTFVARAKDLETCRWLIDRVAETAKG